jgi:hypothetical protein
MKNEQVPRHRASPVTCHAGDHKSTFVTVDLSFSLCARLLPLLTQFYDSAMSDLASMEPIYHDGLLVRRYYIS